MTTSISTLTTRDSQQSRTVTVHTNTNSARQLGRTSANSKANGSTLSRFLTALLRSLSTPSM